MPNKPIKLTVRLAPAAAYRPRCCTDRYLQVKNLTRWKRFVKEQRELLLSSGLPTSTWDNQHSFDDLLMHGYLASAPYWDVPDFDSSEGTALQELVARYLHVFGDPGLCLYGYEEHNRIKQRSRELEG